MAVRSGTHTGTGQVKLAEEQKEAVAKARRPVDLSNKFRLAFLFIAVAALVFIYFGNKIWQGSPWYDNAVRHMYTFLLWDILLMLASTLVKFYFVARYNKFVKSLKSI